MRTPPGTRLVAIQPVPARTPGGPAAPSRWGHSTLSRPCCTDSTTTPLRTRDFAPATAADCSPGRSSAARDAKRFVEQMSGVDERPFAAVGGGHGRRLLRQRRQLSTAVGHPDTGPHCRRRPHPYLRSRTRSGQPEWRTVGDTVVCYGRWSLFSPPRGGVWATLWADELGAVAVV